MSKTRQMIGKRLREYRKSKKYSIEELAHKCGLNPAHLGKIERGERNFTIETLDKIVTALDLSYRELFDFDTRIKPTQNPIIEKTVSYLEIMTLEEQEHIYKTACFLAARDQEKKTR